MLYTTYFLEKSIKVFIKKDDPKLFERVEKAFIEYCSEINMMCQEAVKDAGLILVFEGRGGTPQRPDLR